MAEVLVKLEYYTPTASYKDRMAAAMIVVAGDGLRDQGLPLYADFLGRIFRGEAVHDAAFRRGPGDLPAPGGKLVPDLYQEMKRRAEELAREPETFYTDQFHNEDAIRAYIGVGRELMEQAGIELTAFCGGVGTAGMLVGVSRALKASGCHARIVELEPTTSPGLSTGKGDRIESRGWLRDSGRRI